MRFVLDLPLAVLDVPFQLRPDQLNISFELFVPLCKFRDLSLVFLAGHADHINEVIAQIRQPSLGCHQIAIGLFNGCHGRRPGAVLLVDGEGVDDLSEGSVQGLSD